MIKKRFYRRYSKYSIENPEVWAICQDKDSKQESRVIAKLLKKYGKVKTVLDVGCGVGSHVFELSKKGFLCKGLDADPAKVKFAQKRYPDLTFETADMRVLKEKRKYDAIVCWKHTCF
jgi:2-polyprenyl-3-methyl-5-hydroxy-6-metoxy-1,4-benzoquinol methylase